MRTILPDVRASGVKKITFCLGLLVTWWVARPRLERLFVDFCVRQEYIPVLLIVILGLYCRLPNVYPNYDSPEYSFLTEAASICQTGYCTCLHIWTLTMDSVCDHSAWIENALRKVYFK